MFNYRNNNNNFVQLNLTGLGTGWAPVILDQVNESYVLEHAVSQSCRYTWIGGSTDRGCGANCTHYLTYYLTDYFANYSGTRQTIVTKVENLYSLHLSLL